MAVAAALALSRRPPPSLAIESLPGARGEGIDQHERNGGGGGGETKPVRTAPL
jgi:hypothetical protein